MNHFKIFYVFFVFFLVLIHNDSAILYFVSNWNLIFHKLIMKQIPNGTAWKVPKCEVISGPYFPVFGLNKEIYEVNLRIQSEYSKIRTRINSVFGHFSRSGFAKYVGKVSVLIFLFLEFAWASIVQLYMKNICLTIQI